MLKNLINLIFPKLCNGCKNLLLKNEIIICSQCIHDLPFTLHHNLYPNEASKKFDGIIPIEFCSSMLYFHHDGIVQNLIHDLKYRNQQKIGTLLGNWYANDLKTIHEKFNFTEIIPVPLHSKRLEERGYNQVTTFCEAIAKGIEIPLNSNLLFRNRYSKTQTQKDKEHRKEVSNALFDVKFTNLDHNKHFLLVDDVITSGATLEACTRALLKIPDAKVSIITMAYTLS